MSCKKVLIYSQVCRTVPGFLRVAFAEPTPEKGYVYPVCNMCSQGVANGGNSLGHYVGWSTRYKGGLIPLNPPPPKKKLCVAYVFNLS